MVQIVIGVVKEDLPRIRTSFPRKTPRIQKRISGAFRVGHRGEPTAKTVVELLMFSREFPRSVREIENTWLHLSDGTRLAARIWLPEDAEAAPVPAVVEYLPYRKDDLTLAYDGFNGTFAFSLDPVADDDPSTESPSGTSTPTATGTSSATSAPNGNGTANGSSDGASATSNGNGAQATSDAAASTALHAPGHDALHGAANGNGNGASGAALPTVTNERLDEAIAKLLPTHMQLIMGIGTAEELALAEVKAQEDRLLIDPGKPRIMLAARGRYQAEFAVDLARRRGGTLFAIFVRTIRVLDEGCRFIRMRVGSVDDFELGIGPDRRRGIDCIVAHSLIGAYVFGAAEDMVVGLPETRRLMGVISGHGHKDQPDPVCFRFVLSGEFQHSHLCANADSLKKQLFCQCRILTQSTTQRAHQSVGDQSLAHPLPGVIGHCMSHLVAHYHRYSGFILAYRHYTAVESNLSSGHAPRVDHVRVINKVELPLKARQLV